MKVAIDTNVLAYAEGVNGEDKKAAALAVLERLPTDSTFIPIQTLGELLSVLVKKARRSPAEARDAVLTWGDAFPLIETSPSIMLAAAELGTAHGFGVWDGVILAAAADEGCRLLLSEDMQDGFTWSGVTIVNPFGSVPHVLLHALLEPDDSASAPFRQR